MSLQVVPKDLRNLRACLLCSLVKVWFALLWVWCWSSRFCWLIPFFRFSCLLLRSCVIKVTTQSSGWLFCHCCGSAWHRIREREREREQVFLQQALCTTTVDSRVLQDTVLGPLLFLCHRWSPTIPIPRDSQIPGVPFRRWLLIHSEISDFSDHNTLQEDWRVLSKGTEHAVQRHKVQHYAWHGPRSHSSTP